MFATLSIIDSSFVGIYGGDRVQLACKLVRICFQMLPFSINCFVNEHLPVMLAILKRMNVPDKEWNRQRVKATNEARTRQENALMTEPQESGSPTVLLMHGDI
jgi:hypothetical protein